MDKVSGEKSLKEEKLLTVYFIRIGNTDIPDVRNRLKDWIDIIIKR